ncbi:putative GTP-binding protein 6, partial [Echinops telfairi]|uniref:GTP-binding protein 6 n=1 Tax=Echinops telfairi TaxID=9371 RepID=A0AC55D4T8_ECHTE
WGVQVFDRFTIVLHIFRCHARTKEARLQLALAELPLLRANLKKDPSQLDQQGRGSRYIMGSGETFLQERQRLLKDREARIRKALRKLAVKRRLLRGQRQRRELPTVAVVGYTNSGTRPPSLQDVIVHVRDVSHPETELQKASVLSALHGLRLPAPLLGSLVEVHNKVDLVPGYRPAEPGALAVSALLGQGLQDLRRALEAAVLKATGRRLLTLRIPLHGAQLRSGRGGAQWASGPGLAGAQLS